MKIFHLLLLSWALAALEARAADLRPDGWFVQAGGGERSTATVGAGAVWRWSWRRSVGPGEASGITEAFVSGWSAPDNGERHTFTQVGVLPLLRYRGDQGRSPWFVEAGIGLTLMNRLYRTDSMQFSTRFNFADVIGIGRNFGEGGRHELGLRITHFSNGGIKRPNPGADLVRLRYGVMF